MDADEQSKNRSTCKSKEYAYETETAANYSKSRLLSHSESLTLSSRVFFQLLVTEVSPSSSSDIHLFYCGHAVTP
jgi:hypothetical protein